MPMNFTQKIVTNTGFSILLITTNYYSGNKNKNLSNDELTVTHFKMIDRNKSIPGDTFIKILPKIYTNPGSSSSDSN